MQGLQQSLQRKDTARSAAAPHAQAYSYANYISISETWRYVFVPHNVLPTFLLNDSGILLAQMGSDFPKAIMAKVTAIWFAAMICLHKMPSAITQTNSTLLLTSSWTLWPDASCRKWVLSSVWRVWLYFLAQSERAFLASLDILDVMIRKSFLNLISVLYLPRTVGYHIWYTDGFPQTYAWCLFSCTDRDKGRPFCL